MSATVYEWIIVYEDGQTELKCGEHPADFIDEVNVPIAIIRKNINFLGVLL